MVGVMVELLAVVMAAVNIVRKAEDLVVLTGHSMVGHRTVWMIAKMVENLAAEMATMKAGVMVVVMVDRLVTR